MTRLTREEIRTIVGDLDDGRIAEIIATGATAAELLEAFTWLNENEELPQQTERAPKGRVAQLCEILAANEITEEEERPG
jgi:hypothetical protein